jgi:FMN phosphatase YigB (HAD superfamily)
MNKTFFFDLDDTLIRGTSNLYSRSIVQACDLIYDALGHKAPSHRELYERQDKIDAGSMVKSDFSDIDRFPESLVLTYRSCCDGENMKYDRTVEDKLRDIGRRVFDYRVFEKLGLRAGAEDTIKFIREQGDDVHILTLGNRKVQKCKIIAVGLDELVREENIHVVPRKETGVYAAHTTGRNRDACYMVGDSLKSDINPSTEDGLRAIYLPVRRMQWSFDTDPRGLLYPERVIEFQHILDIKHNYKLLDAIQEHKKIQDEHRKLLDEHGKCGLDPTINPT